MSNTVDNMTFYEKLCSKLKQMRALQAKKKSRAQFGHYRLPVDEEQKLSRLEREVDKMLILDEQGQRVYLKNN